ncbi:MAG: FkbM family methyltransferase [Chitinophagales bacterium]|nr:FkbM family methyltransferase [Chitinophagales bacterium]MDW8419913.1 FkbM family methyltransferase [Chitinophagales bacterium]
MDLLRQYYYRLLTLKAYIDTWGAVEGLRIYFAIRRKGDTYIKVTIPDYPHPVFLRPGTSDVYAFEHVFAHRCYHTPQVNPQNVSVVIDGGANAGYSAVYFAVQYPKARVISIEPSDANCQLIRLNIQGYPNIELVHSALWKSDTYLKITNHDVSYWAFTVSETIADDPAGFRAVSLKHIIDKYNIKSIDVLKLDIEGSELELFDADPHEWLRITRVLIVELHERLKPGCEAAFLNAIGRYAHSRTRSGENEVVIFHHSEMERAIA